MRYHGRYYDLFLGTLYLSKYLILLVGAPGLELKSRRISRAMRPAIRI